MSSWRPRSRRGRLLLGAAVTLIVLIGGAAVFAATREGDVSNPEVEFREEPAETPVPTETPAPRKRDGRPRDTFVWGTYGYSKDRRRYLPASASLRPPFHRRWALTGSVLLEFPVILAGPRLFLLKNNGALYAASKRTGKVLWKRKLGHLAAASPAYAQGRVFVTILERGKGVDAGRVAALRARDGAILWSRPLASRSESSPVVDGDRLFFGSEGGKLYALDTRDGSVRWTYQAGGAIKGAPALAGGKVYVGDYSGRVHAVRRRDGHRVWSTGTSGRGFGLASGQFYSSPAVAYGRVYIGNTDGKVYSFSSDSGKLAWRMSTGGYVYASPAVAQVPGGRPTVYLGSYDGTFYALDARTGRKRWTHRAGGKISGSATVVGDIVYFSNLGKKSTVGLGARTGRKVFDFGRGAYNPVVSDGKVIYLTGYSSVYALRPKRG